MKLRLYYTISLLILFYFCNLNAQSKNYYRDYLLSYPQTAITAVNAPGQWEPNDWIKAGSVIVIGSSIYLLDEDIRAAIVRNRNSVTYKIADTGNFIGDGRNTIPLIAITWLGGYAFDSPKTQDTALLVTKSMLFANGLTTVLKYSTQRYRPNKNRGNSFWNGNNFTHHRDSFPSGHTTFVWSIAPVLAEQYKDTGWAPPLAYGIACLTGYSRMHDEKHWPSDVFAGAAIGYFTAQLVLKTTPTIFVTPSIEPLGIQFSWIY